MKNIIISLQVFLLLFIVGCGSGNNNQYNNTNTPLLTMETLYQGKTDKASINENNQMLFLQSIYNLYFFALVTDEITPDIEKDKNVLSDINPKTGREQIKIVYSNYVFNAYQNTLLKFNGSVFIELKENHSSHIKYDIIFDNFYVSNANFEMLINANLTIYQDYNNEEITFHYLSIIDKKLDENIFYKDLTYSNNTSINYNGDIYIENEGYVTFTQKDYDINLDGYIKNIISFNLWSSPHKLTLKTEQDEEVHHYYILDNKVSSFEPPTINYCQIEAPKDAKISCDIENNTSTYIKWYVNNTLVEDIDTNILPYHLFQKGDSLEAIIVATNNDIASNKVISSITIDNRAPVVNVDYNKINTLKVKSTEFSLDAISVFDPDGDTLTYTWRVENEDIKIINQTENSKIVQIKLLQNQIYSPYRIFLNVSDGDSKTEIYIDFDIKGGFFSKESIKIPINSLPYTTKLDDYLKVIDINNDNLNDIIFSSSIENGMRINLYKQTSENNFSFDSFNGYEKYTAIEIDDLNNDDLPDIILSEKEQIKILYQNNENHFEDSIDINISTDDDYFDKVIIGDFNDDNLPDIATLNWMGTAIYIMFQTDEGNYTIPKKTVVSKEVVNEQYYGNQIKIGDFNGDHKDDIIISNKKLNKFYILIQDEFEEFLISEYSIDNYSNSNDPLEQTILLDINIGDINNDNNDDIVINTLYPNNILLIFYGSDESATLSLAQKISTTYKNIYASIIDIEGDGKNEILTSTSLIQLNEKNFEEILLDEEFPGYLMTTADYDLNEKEDVIIIDAYERELIIYLSNSK